MSGYNQFSSDALEKRKGLNGVFVPGEFDLWYPFIKLDSKINVGAALCRFVEGHGTQDDQELFFTFFHEYLHLIQSAMYFVCQLPIIQTHNIIYDIRVTALRRKSNGEQKLTPIVFSAETIYVHNLIKKEFEAIKKEALPILKKDFSVINILEGVVRILEEKYRGRVLEKNHWRYTAIKEINQCVLKNRALTERNLLDLCDVALGRTHSAYVFIQMLEYIKGSAVASYGYKEFSEIADELGAKRTVSVSNQIITNSARVFNSSLYVNYLGQITAIYGKLPSFFQGQPVFSTMYDAISNEDAKGLPNCLLMLMHLCGSPVILNSEGAMEVFDINKEGVSRIDQNIVGIKAVVENIVANTKGCLLRKSCILAKNHGQELPVDSLCDDGAWKKKPISGNICPYSAIWKAFGLEGLTL